MGYDLRMADIFKVRTKIKIQLMCWERELVEIGDSLIILSQTEMIKGKAGTQLHNNIAQKCLKIHCKILQQLQLYEEIWDTYVEGWKNIDESNSAHINQEILEECNKTLKVHQKTYEDIYDSVDIQLRSIHDLFTWELESLVPYKIQSAVDCLCSIDHLVGDYDEAQKSVASSVADGAQEIMNQMSQ